MWIKKFNKNKFSLKIKDENNLRKKNYILTKICLTNLTKLL